MIESREEAADPSQLELGTELYCGLLLASEHKILYIQNFHLSQVYSSEGLIRIHGSLWGEKTL